MQGRQPKAAAATESSAARMSAHGLFGGVGVNNGGRGCQTRAEFLTYGRREKKKKKKTRTHYAATVA